MDEIAAPAELWLPNAHWHQMRHHVAGLAPEEACGLLGGHRAGGRHLRGLYLFPIENVLHSPSRFRMDPHQQLKALLFLDEAGLDLLAIYHSHPAGPPHPSPLDVAEAAYPGVAHLIWSPTGPYWDCRAFAIEDDRAWSIPVYRLMG